LPEWVEPAAARCSVNDRPHGLTFGGRYAAVGRVTAGDVVAFEFPIHERSQQVTIEGRPYNILRRGNDVVAIDPPGKNGPLYQRAHYRSGETLWRQTTRFVPDEELEW
jgi:hypothetical protein